VYFDAMDETHPRPDPDTRPLAEQKAAEWARTNAEAIVANLKRVEQFGTFGEDLRSW